MICPHCGTEYRDGFVVCADCGAPLVVPHPDGSKTDPPLSSEIGSPHGSVPPRSPLDQVELVTVFRSNNRVAMEIAESILRSAELEFMTRGKDIQGLFGWGAFPAGNSLAMGPMEIQVRREDSRDALDMLAHLSGAADSQELDETFDPGDPAE